MKRSGDVGPRHPHSQGLGMATAQQTSHGGGQEASFLLAEAPKPPLVPAHQNVRLWFKCVWHPSYFSPLLSHLSWAAMVTSAGLTQPEETLFIFLFSVQNEQTLILPV